MFSLVLFCSCVFCPFSITITSFGEEKANLSGFRTFVRFALVWFCLFPFLRLGRAAVCDCGTPWTFFWPFFLQETLISTAIWHLLLSPAYLNIRHVFIYLVYWGSTARQPFLVGHFVSSPREREKSDWRDSIGYEREGQGRLRSRNRCEETEEIKTPPLLLPATRIASLAQL